MPVFNFSQFEHKHFWSYSSRFNDYHLQLNQNFEKWKIYEIVVVGLNAGLWCYVESICLGGVLELLTRTQDEVWDFFGKLA